ncbi:MAG: cupin-like domain-containing protein [Sandaracinaceae bacterium]
MALTSSLALPPVSAQLPEVPRLDRPTAAELTEVMDAGRPCILTGCMTSWPLYRLLSRVQSESEQVAVLKALGGSTPVAWSSVPDGYLGLDESFQPLFEYNGCRGTFAEAMDAVEADLWSAAPSASYLHKFSVPALNTMLGGLPAFAALDPLVPPKFWIGSGGQRLRLHHDAFHNSICMVAGLKRITLFPPESIADVYPSPLHRTFRTGISSSISIRDADMSRFPRYRRALDAGLVAHVEAGEVLYVPPFWWHEVESFGLNVMVNCFYRGAAPECVDAFQAAVLELAAAFRDRSPSCRAIASALTRGREDTSAAELTEEEVGAVRRFLAVVEDAEESCVHTSFTSFAFAYADWIAFRLHGEEAPFPGHEGAFEDMLAYVAKHDVPSVGLAGQADGAEHLASLPVSPDAALVLNEPNLASLERMYVPHLRGGALSFRSRAPVGVGQRVQILVESPSLQAEGTVAWVDERDDDTACGILLDELRGEGGAELAAAIRRAQNLAG